MKASWQYSTTFSVVFVLFLAVSLGVMCGSSSAEEYRCDPRWFGCSRPRPVPPQNPYEFENTARSLGIGTSKFLSNPAMLGWSRVMDNGFDFLLAQTPTWDYSYSTYAWPSDVEFDGYWFHSHSVVPFGCGAFALSHLTDSQDADDNGAGYYRHYTQYKVGLGFRTGPCLSMGYEFGYIDKDYGSTAFGIDTDSALLNRVGATYSSGNLLFNVGGYLVSDDPDFDDKTVTYLREDADSTQYGFDCGMGLATSLGICALSFEYDYLKNELFLFDDQGEEGQINQTFLDSDRVYTMRLGSETRVNRFFTARYGIGGHLTEDDDYVSLNTGFEWSLTPNFVIDYGFEGRTQDRGFGSTHAVGCAFRF